MNERIKELAEQAGGYWNHGDFNMGSSVEFQEGDLEKFAELIIRECARVVQNADLEDVDGGDSAVLRAASHQIKKHFGVE